MRAKDYRVSKEEMLNVISIISEDTSEEFLKIVESVYPSAYRMGLNNAARVAMFVANCAHESSGFMRLEENMNYSAKRLRQVWPSRFRSSATARKYAYNPEGLAAYVYNGRMGNRPGTDDGWRYRGSGFIQLTGRSNFEKYAKITGTYIDVDPDTLRKDKHLALITAIAYFCHRRYKGKSLLEWADLGSHINVCRGINGGTHGLNERTANARLILDVLKEDEGGFTLPIVKRGSKGLRVRPVQYKLKLLGYKIYNVDGIFGKGTEAAVKHFQSRNDLKPDGIVGGKTLTAINKALFLKGYGDKV
ncbi:glycohydrolase [Vibrio phage BONAISHI]|nr:glycohydrolase [Vibrio phage BONAISHI]